MRYLTALGWLLALWAGDASAAPTLGGSTSPDGKVAVQVDLPTAQRLHNKGGTDGSGLCVFTSIEHSARWQNETSLIGFQAKMQRERGGGWPSKVDSMIAKYAPGTQYLQYEGTDPAILIEALKSGRMPAVTYNGHDPHYKGSIAHMVNLVAYDQSQVAILDNNFVGDNQLVWMTPAEFHQRWCGHGSGWAVCLLAPPPPPVPVNHLHDKVASTIGDYYTGTSYQWFYDPESSRVQVYLFEGGKQIGGYDWALKLFRFREGPGRWLAPCPPPFQPPATPASEFPQVLESVTDFGVSLGMFPYRGKGEDRVIVNGKRSSVEEALGCLGRRPRNPDPKPAPNPAPKPPLPNDTSQLRLTVAGPGYDLVLKDLKIGRAHV